MLIESVFFFHLSFQFVSLPALPPDETLEQGRNALRWLNLFLDFASFLVLCLRCFVFSAALRNLYLIAILVYLAPTMHKTANGCWPHCCCLPLYQPDEVPTANNERELFCYNVYMNLHFS